MSTTSRRKRSAAVPLTLVPALAVLLGACSSRGEKKSNDPCESYAYDKTKCETAVTNRGYSHGGVFYPMIYPYGALFYHNRYSQGVIRGRTAGGARSNVVRGGFGGIGGTRGIAGS